jgi:large subunit ribosomal protein L10
MVPSDFNIKKVAEIKDAVQGADAVWIVDYRGLSVKQVESLRAKLGEVDAHMKIFKNTLTKLALEALELPTLDDILAGPSGFVFVSGDPVASAKAL